MMFDEFLVSRVHLCSNCESENMSKRIRTCGQNWSEVDTETLISVIRKHPEIFDTSIPRNKHITDPIWQNIAEQLSRDHKECVQKWSALKTYYRQELKKVELKVYVCKWAHRDSMAFFMPFLKEKRVSIKCVNFPIPTISIFTKNRNLLSKYCAFARLCTYIYIYTTINMSIEYIYHLGKYN